MNDLKWCLNDDPHSEHWAYNEFNGRNYCSGRPEGRSMSEYTDELARVIRRVDGTHSLGAGALAEALSAWVAEHDRQVAERAWDEGFTRGFYSGQAMPRADASESPVTNPYLKTGEQA